MGCKHFSFRSVFSLTRGSRKHGSNLAGQILSAKTNNPSLFAESLLRQIKGAGKYKQSIFCNCSSSRLCVMPP